MDKQEISSAALADSRRVQLARLEGERDAARYLVAAYRAVVASLPCSPEARELVPSDSGLVESAQSYPAPLCETRFIRDSHGKWIPVGTEYTDPDVAGYHAAVQALERAQSALDTLRAGARDESDRAWQAPKGATTRGGRTFGGRAEHAAAREGAALVVEHVCSRHPTARTMAPPTAAELGAVGYGSDASAPQATVVRSDGRAVVLTPCVAGGRGLPATLETRAVILRHDGRPRTRGKRGGRRSK